MENSPKSIDCFVCENRPGCLPAFRVDKCNRYKPAKSPYIPVKDYVVTDPEAIDIVNQDVKADDGKPHLSLVPAKILFAIEKIRTYGNNKYPKGGKDNWKMVEPMRHYEASLRHTAKHWNDPFAIDPESGLPHYFHKVCDDAFFIELNWDKFMEAIEKHKEVT